MKADDFKRKHEPVQSTPKAQADVDRLEAIWNMFSHAASQASGQLQCILPIRQGVETVEILPGVFLAIGGKPHGPFQGIGMCKHCVALGVMNLRDAANALDDLIKEVAKHETAL